MITELGNKHGIVLNLVNDPVFVRNAARPVTGQGVFQGLWLSNALEGRSFDLLDQTVDATKNLLIGSLPIEIIVPGMI